LQYTALGQQPPAAAASAGAALTSETPAELLGKLIVT
jgi:hypothetical protein